MYQLLTEMKEPNAARLQLDEAVKANPGDPEPYVILGNLALQDLRLVEATMDFEKAKQLLAGYNVAKRKKAKEVLALDAASGIARVAEIREDWPQAESCLREVWQLDPENVFTYQRLARALFQQRKPKEAYEMLKLGKQQDRTNARRYRTGETFLTPEAIMAQYYDQYGGLTTAPAEYMFNKALEVAPNDLPTRQAVAVWALEKGKLALAKEQVKAILKIEASDRRYEGSNVGRELGGLVALWEKDWPAAEKCFQEVLDESRTDLAARNNIALALVEQNEQNDQEDSAKKRPELDKKPSELDKKPSELDKKPSELDKKPSELDKKPSELDKKPSELDKKPSALEKKRREVDKKPRALEYALANYNEHKDNPEVLSTLGWVYYRNERFDDAGTVLEQAVKTTPGKLLDHPDLVTFVAHVLHHRGRDEEAKVYLQEILQNDRPFSMRPEAMKLYEEVRDAKPDAKRVKALTDQLRVEKGPSAAGLQFDKAVRANPGEPAPYVILGKFALRDRRLSEATMDFEKAKQLLAGYTSPQGKEAAKQTMEWDTQSGIARVAESREDWREAEPRLRDLLKVDPENLYTYQRLARALFQQGKVNEAYDMLKKGKQQDIASAKKNKTREQFLTPEAIMAQYYDQYDPTSGNAEVMFKRAIEAAPGNLPTRQVFAVWALEKGRLALAKEQAEAILKIDNGSNVGRELRGLVALREKDWPTAERYFQEVRLESPTDFVARNNIALALVEQNDPAKRQQALDYALANYGDSKYKANPKVLSTLGWVYFRTGQFDLAGTTLEQAVKATGGNLAEDPDLVTYWAHFLRHRQRDREAYAFLQAILKDGRPFFMRPEAQKLRDEIEESAKRQAAGAAAKTP
jgi:tetratricopeptide (TPR) repeat protein